MNQEKVYACNLIFHVFLGFECEYSEHSKEQYIVAGDRFRFYVPDRFFSKASDNWLNGFPRDFDPEPVYVESVVGLHKQIPTWFSVDRDSGDSDLISATTSKEDAVSFSFDIIGTVFFLISRYEEALSQQRDEHGRFRLVDSVLNSGSLYMRPIVNEYLGILTHWIKKLSPELKLNQRKFKQYLSCDVDSLYFPAGYNVADVCRFLASTIKRRRPIGDAIRTVPKIRATHFGGFEFDPYNTFKYLTDLAKTNNAKSQFYIMAIGDRHVLDGNYSLNDDRLRVALEVIAGSLNFELGLHGSYQSYTNKELLESERDALSALLDDIAPGKTVTTSRQHYLRWDNLKTPKILADSGFTLDSSLTFAETSGFRSSCCYSYPIFDLCSRQTLKLWEQPLTLMDGSLTAKKYLGYSNSEDAIKYAKQLKKECIFHNGEFTLLWHNSSLLGKKDRTILETIMEYEHD